MTKLLTFSLFTFSLLTNSLLTNSLLTNSLLTNSLLASERPPEFIDGFESDGCSAYPDSAGYENGPNWLHCCFVHDIRYWMGGSWRQRYLADVALRECVSEASHPAHGELMFNGVRAGGHPDTELPWRWGYGYAPGRGYRYRSLRENEMILSRSYTVEGEIHFWMPEMTSGQIDYIRKNFEIIKEELSAK